MQITTDTVAIVKVKYRVRNPGGRGSHLRTSVSYYCGGNVLDAVAQLARNPRLAEVECLGWRYSA